jgi:alpha-glucosidase (family GH31 glycosyl hydrolase)
LTNPENNELIFTTENTDFLYSDLFISFAGFISTNDVYGFGERYHELKLGDGKFTMWPNDTSGIHPDTGEGGYNAMGIHPLGFHKTTKNTFVGLLFNNINAQDLIIKSNYTELNENHVLFEHITIGGVIDYFITLNDTPDKALISLHDIIGHPALPPFWSLGFHQCKWGYKNDKEIRYVYENYISNQLPIDTFWGDIDILQDYRIFTLNQQEFADLPNLIHELHENNYKFIPIVDLGFPMKEIDEYYMRGKETNAFIKSNYTNEDLIIIKSLLIPLYKLENFIISFLLNLIKLNF